MAPRTRKDGMETVPCTSYGRDRRERYGKEYFFCSPCDLVDQERQANPFARCGGRRYQCAANHIREEVFTDWRVAKAMDDAGIKLNLKGLEVLRCLDAPGKWERSFIPSASAKQLE